MPAHGLDGLERARPQLFALHADKPLFCSPENHWIVATPAVRIAVLEVHLGCQCAMLRQKPGDNGVDLPNCLANQFCRERATCAFGLEDTATCIYGTVNGQSITLGDYEV